MKNLLEGKDVLTGQQFSKEEILQICEVAAHMEEAVRAGKDPDYMNRKILATLFFEPSTRTRLSFEAAMLRVGGQVISVAGGAASSAAKGETVADTAKTVDGYVDVIVCRHPAVGSAQEAADAAEVPVINGGDGTGQHPTQALLDMYTIQKEKGTLTGLTCCLLGDLKNGRTVHSLSQMLALFGNKIVLTSPEPLQMPDYIMSALKERGAEIEVVPDVHEALRASDILYVTRVQRERFASEEDYLKVKGSYIVDMDMVNRAKKGLTILHPLPRVDEIDYAVDNYPGAAYFRQAHNGMYVRMALLAMVTGSISWGR